jgi:hypothetical protein
MFLLFCSFKKIVGLKTFIDIHIEMPRVSSSSRPSFRSSSPSRSSSSSSKPMSSVVPHHSSSVPAIAQVKPPSFLQSAKEGFGLGFGASIARNIVDRAFGTATAAASAASAIPVAAPKHVASYDVKLYEQCIQNGATEEFCRQIAVSNDIKSSSTS